VATKPVPVPDPESEGFWSAAAAHVLAIQRCTNCGWYAYPPYVVAEVELEEQEGLRIVARLVGGRPGDVAIGTAVEVAFDDVDAGIAVPHFVPAAGQA
jgi:uncharacterized OB-fold protein